MEDGKTVVRRTMTLAASEKRAFDLFTRELGTWWPRDLTWSKDKLENIVIEPRQGGRCFERSTDGAERDWGRVLAWEEPRRVVFTWQITQDREPIAEVADASEVEVRFTAESPKSTRMELDHRYFDRHGDDAESYCAAMDGPKGWTRLLGLYVEALRKKMAPSGV